MLSAEPKRCELLLLAVTCGALSLLPLLAPAASSAAVGVQPEVPWTTNPSSGRFDISQFGAIGDGATSNTAAIAAAVRSAAHYYRTTGNRGYVHVPPGIFLSGQVVLQSGVYLEISPAGVLTPSVNLLEFPVTVGGAWPFIHASEAHDIGIIGGGTVNGGFEKWIAGFDDVENRFLHLGWRGGEHRNSTTPSTVGPEDESRPRNAILASSTRVLIQDVTFTGSPDWTLHLFNCSFVTVRNYTARGDERWPNNDALDLDSCSHVLVEDSSIDVADDGVCIKGAASPTRNITVRRVQIRSRSSAIKFGSNCPQPMSELLFEDIYIHDSNRGLALQARDGGAIENVTFRRVVINGTRFWPYSWWGDGSALYISSMLRNVADPGCKIQNITFQDIWAVSQAGSVFSGKSPGHPLHGVTLRNVTLIIDRWPDWNYSISSMPSISPALEYEPTSIEIPGNILPSHRVPDAGWMAGVYAEAVEGFVMEGVTIHFNNRNWQEYWGSACVNVSVAGYRVTQNSVECAPPRPKQALRDRAN